MNSKIAVCLVVLVMACGMALSDDAPAQPATDNGGVPSSGVGKPVGYCSSRWHGYWSQYLSDRLNCRAFYECSNGIPYHFDCPRGTCWNPFIETCDHIGSSGCAFPCNQ